MWETARDSLSSWVPVSHTGVLDEALNSFPALASPLSDCCGHWGSKPEDESNLSFCFSFSVTLSNNKQEKKRKYSAILSGTNEEMNHNKNYRC